jgi:hypothetical protein
MESGDFDFSMLLSISLDITTTSPGSRFPREEYISARSAPVEAAKVALATRIW